MSSHLAQPGNGRWPHTASLLQNVAVGFCFLFGVALILNIHPLGDGAWFWYAKFIGQGARLYADLHLPLQPLFVLQTELNRKIFGEGWLLSKLPALMEMGLYLLGIRWIATYSVWKDWQKAVLVACAFCFGTLFAAYRFDDYHVLADIFTICSVILLLKLSERAIPWRQIVRLVALLGIMSGLAITTRVNDGAMLFLSSLFAILLMVPEKRFTVAGIFGAATAVSVCAVVLITGDTLRDYALFSILHSSSSKGGLLLLARSVLLFPLKTLKLLLTVSSFRNILLAGIAVTAACISLLFRSRGKNSRISAIRVIFCLIPLAALGRFVLGGIISGDVGVALGGTWIFVACVISAVVIFRALQIVTDRPVPNGWNVRESLLLIPVGQLLSSSMSSAGIFIGLYTPVGLFLLLLPIAWPLHLQKTWWRSTVLVSATLMLITTLFFKSQVPFSWHTYIEPPMFTERVWYPHPLYGPMYLEKRQLDLIEPMCETVKRSGPNPELLSLPYPYVNYFCGITPWHGYIQTFFDTVSSDTVQNLMGELESAPPQWIVYQRQLAIIELHEIVYNRNKPLQHRFLNEQIMQKLKSGEWKLISEWNSYADRSSWGKTSNATWMLIRTR